MISILSFEKCQKKKKKYFATLQLESTTPKIIFLCKDRK